MSDSPITPTVPQCSECGLDLRIEPIAAGTAVRIAYLCWYHGLIAIADPSEATNGG